MLRVFPNLALVLGAFGRVAGVRSAAAGATPGGAPPAPAAVPADWTTRQSTGNLVYSALSPGPDGGKGPHPLPNYGNGYAATQYGQPTFYVAGLFSGPLPPPFGTATGAVSQRAGLPSVALGADARNATALALDFGHATVEELLPQPGGGVARQTHYFHRERKHLIVAQVELRAGGALAAELELSSTLHPCSGPGACVPWQPAPPPSDEASCFVAIVAGEKCDGDVLCKQLPPAQRAGYKITAAMCTGAGKSTLRAAAGSTARATRLASVWTSLESADPLAEASKEWVAQAALVAADPAALWNGHVEAQAALLSPGIEVEELHGSRALAQNVNASLYGILISLRDELNFSTSPGGLPNGCYNGHAFWDVEQFIWPNLMLLQPKMATAAMQYRYDRMETARLNALVMRNASKMIGRQIEGLKFPWESAFTGLANTPACCNQNEYHEIHISGDVSLAMWQTWQSTRDKAWLARVGWPVIKGVAEFWASRVTASTLVAVAAPQYGLLDVGGPDETFSHVNQSAYDLSVASVALANAVKAAAVVGQSASVPANWSAIAAGLLRSLPSDGLFDDIGPTAPSCAPRTPSGKRGVALMQEFRGADAAFAAPGRKGKPNGIGPIMMRYPLNISREFLSDDLHRSDLEHYCSQWPAGNSMYWSMFTIGHADLGDTAATDFFFAKSSVANIFGPFRIWSEAPGGGGCPNFLTGAGIWLQSLWAGYLGLRMTDDALTIRGPRLPPNATTLTLRSVAYAGARLSLRLNGDGLHVCQTAAGRNKLLVAVDGGASSLLAAGGPCVTLKREGRIFLL